MVAQNRKEKISAEIFGIFDCLLPQNPSNQSSLLSWLFKTKWKTKSQNPKTGGSRDIFLPENDFKSCSRVHLLAYPDWATFPRFPRVGLFMAVFSAFFHLDQSCTILGAIFHKQKSSVTDSFHDLRGLPLPWQPDMSISVQRFIQSWPLSPCPYDLKRFILNLDSNGWRLKREYMSCRHTSSSALTLHI